MAALFIAAALFITAWELARGAVDRLLDPPSPLVDWRSIGALVFGATVQGATGWWELRQARRLNSEVLHADARHTLASIGVSAAVLAGLLLVWLGYPLADPIVALLVAAVIAKIGVDTVRENLPALVDRATSPPRTSAVVTGVEGVRASPHPQSRPARGIAIDLHVRRPSIHQDAAPSPTRCAAACSFCRAWATSPSCRGRASE